MDFDEHVRRALDTLPPELARKLENVAVSSRNRIPRIPTCSGCSRRSLISPPR